MNPHQRLALEKLWTSPAALESIREFEDQRHQLFLLDDTDKPDKHATAFVSEADLVWAWLAHEFMTFTTEATSGELAQLWAQDGKQIALDYLERFETTDPPQVELVKADGGLRY